ncbi:hypothetical protein N658DRAFT_499238 [Parathielavia hyrcaniae]|uniref:Uncharacterized protein n=1 Tax=Parathielavia hyrcaniae TaxID=113614 RepID=A0AAN6PV85_9PEZI|nr:hypothetical protein N658DRAFT_499238 [Parathielavia hyrcaniae]
MPQASNNAQSTTSDDSSWLLASTPSTFSDVPYTPNESGTSEQQRSIIITPKSSSRRRRRIALVETSRATFTTTTTNRARARTGNMAPRHMVNGSPHRRRTSASRQHTSSSLDTAWDSRAESSAGRRRYGDGSSSSAQDWSSVAGASGSSGSAKRQEGGSGGGGGGGSATARGSGSGPGAGSSSGPGSHEIPLTEGNVSQTSEFYEQVRRDRDKTGESEQAQSREAAAQAAVAEIGRKLNESGRW